MMFGVRPSMSSPAAKRIEAAGRQYQEQRQRALARLRDDVPSPPPPPPIEEMPECLRMKARERLIIQSTVEICGVTMTAVRNVSKATKVLTARTIICKRLSDELGYSSIQIGKIVNRDHSSVLNLLRKPMPAIAAQEPNPDQIEMSLQWDCGRKHRLAQEGNGK